MFVMILATLAVQIVIERTTLILAGDQPSTSGLHRSAADPPRGDLHRLSSSSGLSAASPFSSGFWGCSFRGRKWGGHARLRDQPRGGRAARHPGIAHAGARRLRSALLSARFAGILLTPTQFTAFNVGTPFAISGFIAAIVGGFGRPLGAFLGGIALGLAQALAIVFLGAGFKNVAALSMLLLFLFVRPTGLFGSLNSQVRMP